MTLTRSKDPLVWIDCEMTGLDPQIDTILSISCFITDYQLSFLEPNGFDAVIHHSKKELDKMNEWCIATHGASNLTRSCIESSTTASKASTDLLAYIKDVVPEKGVALLAGNSIHADKSFLVYSPWNRVLEHLHYRLFDVSAVKEMMRRWASDDVLLSAPKKELKHTAREDVLESIYEARYYRELILRTGAVPTIK